jgi:hypothetical protein
LGFVRGILAVWLSIAAVSLSAQTRLPGMDSVFLKVFDADLRPVRSLGRLFSKPTVIISHINCIACTEYFTKNKKDFHFLFVLSNESLAEINRILAYHHLKKREVSFTTCRYVPGLKQALCSDPTPCLFYRTPEGCMLWSYAQLSALSNGFSLSIKSLKPKLNSAKTEARF